MLNFKPFCLSKISFLETQRRICWCECEKHTNKLMFSFKATCVIIPRMYCTCATVFHAQVGPPHISKAYVAPQVGLWITVDVKNPINFIDVNFFCRHLWLHSISSRWDISLEFTDVKLTCFFLSVCGNTFSAPSRKPEQRQAPWLHTHERSPEEEVQQIDFQCHYCKSRAAKLVCWKSHCDDSYIPPAVI